MAERVYIRSPPAYGESRRDRPTLRSVAGRVTLDIFILSKKWYLQIDVCVVKTSLVVSVSYSWMRSG